MKPRPFDYARPDTVDETVALLAEHGDEARILAGGQSLMAMMNLRLADPAMLIDIAQALTGGGANLKGVLTHAGSSYDLNTPEALEQLAELRMETLTTRGRNRIEMA